MAEYIEGKRPVVEALTRKMPIEVVLMADNLKADSLTETVVRKCRQLDIPLKKVPQKELDGKSERGSHQGVMARTKPYPYVGIGDIVAAGQEDFERTGRSLVVVLDHITDAGNLGAIARSAEIVGATGIVIPNKRSAHVTAATYKSSAGAISNLKIAQVANLGATIDRLKDEGYWVAGASEKATQTLWDTNLQGKIVLVMGNEAEGMAERTQKKCDFLVALPQVGQIASLNVAQASTALMYEWLRQNWKDA
jgi:23S rRNA (guanosine2251-2'-O)-methyltransferase